MLLIIMRNVQLKTQTEAVGFQRTLPHTFHAGNRIARLFCSGAGGLAMKRKGQSNIALRPGALNPGAVRGEFPLELSAYRRNTEADVGIVLRESSDFNAIDALIEAIDSGFER